MKLIIKAIIYRVMRICVNWTILMIVCQDIHIALKLSIWLLIFSTLQYYVFDWIFFKIFKIGE